MRNDTIEFQKAVDRVAREIATARHRAGVSFVQTPMLYPGGAGVVIRITDAYPDFFVTDYGMGYEEALNLGVSTLFSRHGAVIAERAGIQFDSHAFFTVQVPKEQLAGAVVTVANCSQETVIASVYKAAERKQMEDTEQLYRRLLIVFPNRAVARDATVIGGSTTEWHVATLVRGPNRSSIFEPVSSHHTSIFAAAAKFQDIARVENAPNRISVVHNKDDLKTYLGLLSQNSSVIERTLPDEALKMLAEAA